MFVWRLFFFLLSISCIILCLLLLHTHSFAKLTYFKEHYLCRRHKCAMPYCSHRRVATRSNRANEAHMHTRFTLSSSGEPVDTGVWAMSS